MRTSRRRTLAIACTTAVLAGSLVACGDDDSESATAGAAAATTTAAAEAPPAERKIDSCGTEITVPGDPKTIYTDGGGFADMLLSLGVPVAAVGEPASSLEENYGHAREAIKAAGVKYIGNPDFSQNLEKVAELAPDVMLQFIPGDNRKQLEELAPVAFQPAWCDEEDQKKDFSWTYDSFRWAAEVVGKEDKAEELLSKWEARMTADAAELTEYEGKKIAFAEVFDSGFGVAGGFRRSFDDVFKGMGLTMLNEDKPSVLDYSAEQMTKVLGEADFIILGSYESSEKAREKLFSNPLWERLPAVKAGDVCRVDDVVWGGLGMMWSEAVRQDIKECLTEEPVDGVVDAYDTTQVKPEDLLK